MTANPGCGKSVLARSLVDQFESARNAKVCYFFFKDDSETNRNVNHALCAIVHQLTVQDPGLLKHTTGVFLSDGEQVLNLVESLWKILRLILENIVCPIVCVLDALDECIEASRILLIDKFAQMFAGSSDKQRREAHNFKVIMTSRPNTPIDDALWENGVNPLSIKLSGEREAESQAITNEVDIYISEKIRHFKEMRQHRGVHDETHEVLSSKIRSIENRTYLWVSLVFPELEKNAGVSKTKLIHLVNQVPSTVQAAYERILDKSSDRDQARIMLHIIVSAYRPLTLAEMNVALSVQILPDPNGHLDLEPEGSFEVTVRELCGLFIIIKDRRKYLIHQTAREFLIQPTCLTQDAMESSGWHWRYSFEPLVSHRIAAQKFMKYLYWLDVHQRQSSDKKEEGKAAAPSYVKASLRSINDWTGPFQYADDTWMKHLKNAYSSNTVTDEGSFSEDDVPSIGNVRLTWAQLYKSAPSWSPFPKRSTVYVDFNPLDMASYHGHSIMVKSLLRSHSPTELGISALRWSLQNKYTDIVHMLLDQVPPQDSLVLNACLHIACSVGDSTIVSRLLTLPAVNHLYADSLERTGLFWAVHGGHPDIVKDLLDLRRQDQPESNDLGASLLIAAHQGFYDVLRQLKDFSPSTFQKYRLEAVQYAISKDNALTLFFLLHERDTIALSETEMAHLVCSALVKDSKDCLDYLLCFPFNINASDACGKTPILRTTNRELRIKLLEKGADSNTVASKGWSRCQGGLGDSLLLHAVSGNDVQLTKLLLEKGAAVDLRCRDGETALCRAASNPLCLDSVQILRLLLEAGADPYAQNQFGEYPAKLIEDMRFNAVTLRDNPSISDDHAKIRQLLQTTPHSTRDLLEPAPRVRRIVPSVDAYEEILRPHEDGIDLETMVTFLELDDTDGSTTEHEFSREVLYSLFREDVSRLLEPLELAL